MANRAENPVYVGGLSPQPAAEKPCGALRAEREPAAAELVGLAPAYDTPQGAPLLKIDI